LKLRACLFALLLVAAVAHASSDVKVEDLCRAVVEDSNYKVRVQAALVLGKLGDPRAVQPLIKALADQNKTVRGIAASALGHLGDQAAAEPLRGLLRRESDAFDRGQAEKAVAALSAGGGAAGGKRAKIYVNFGAFAGGVKTAGADASKILHEALSREIGKVPIVTLTLTPADQHNFGKSGMSGFYIDGNITRLEDSSGGGGAETSCDVKVMVARWPQKSIIMWTNAGASVQSGSRPRDRENARRECLEASARGLSEDLVNFLKAQGG
jgi:hypothetical protein